MVETERLRLRPLRGDDVASLLEKAGLSRTGEFLHRGALPALPYALDRDAFDPLS